LDDFLDKFDEKNWPLYYLNWEIDLIHDLGFGFKIDTNKFYETREKKIFNIKVDNIEYKIPNFIVFKNFRDRNIQDICSGLNFSRSLMENKFFIPNNLRFPYSRKLLEKKIL